MVPGERIELPTNGLQNRRSEPRDNPESSNFSPGIWDHRLLRARHE
jgi:hypothetical protein